MRQVQVRIKRRWVPETLMTGETPAGRLVEVASPAMHESSRFSDGRFHNLNVAPDKRHGRWQGIGLMLRFFFLRNADTEPADPIPVQTVTRSRLLALPADQTAVVRLGHSSLLFKIGGQFWLTDPVFSDRASPFSFLGPKRFHKPPISIDELPDIRGVLISHNHYDHLDEAAIRKLHKKVEHFYVPLKVGEHLVRWGVPADKISEYDWWQTEQVDDLKLVALPAQHFSGRGRHDSNRTLWCSWALCGGGKIIYYSGDGGYSDQFKRIGDEYGPFDLTLMETGGYSDNWPHVHMQPEETLQAHLDLRGRQLMPVHNSTFSLSFHPWYEPLERIARLADKHNVPLLTPEIGRIFLLGEHPTTRRWWRDLPVAAEAIRTYAAAVK